MRSDYLKPDNYGKLFVFMQPENVAALRVSLETGMRIGDVLKLKPTDVRGRTITYTAQKTGKRGKAVISQDLANRLRGISGEKFIFPKRGDPDDHRKRQTVWKDVKKGAAALRAAGVITTENISPHSARRSFAVADSEKYGLLHTQRALQHSEKMTTKLYTNTESSATSAELYQIWKRLRSVEEKINLILAFLEITGN